MACWMVLDGMGWYRMVLGGIGCYRNSPKALRVVVWVAWQGQVFLEKAHRPTQVIFKAV